MLRLTHYTPHVQPESTESTPWVEGGRREGGRERGRGGRELGWEGGLFCSGQTKTGKDHYNERIHETHGNISWATGTRFASNYKLSKGKRIRVCALLG